MHHFIAESAHLARLSQLHVFAVTHRGFSVEERESFALAPEQQLRLAQRLIGALPGADLSPACADEALSCATCNRIEIYVVGQAGMDAARVRDTVLAQLCAETNADARLLTRVEQLTGADAAIHLMRVAAGLESVVIGETQILQQLREAYELHHGLGTIGDVLQAHFHTAFKVGRRARAETQISVGHVSTASYAVEMAAALPGGLANRRALLIGAGEIGRLTIKRLVGLGASDVAVVNRTRARAERMVDGLVGQAGHAVRVADWSALDAELTDVDVVFSAIHCAEGEPLVTHSRLSRARHASATDTAAARPIHIFDLGVPRNFASDTKQLPGVELVTVDELRANVDGGRARRLAEVPAVEAIVRQELERLVDPSQTMVRGALNALYRRFSAVAVGEVSRTRKFGVPKTEAELTAFAARMVKRLLSPVAERYAQPADADDTSISQLQSLVELLGVAPPVGQLQRDAAAVCHDAMLSASAEQIDRVLTYHARSAHQHAEIDGDSPAGCE